MSGFVARWGWVVSMAVGFGLAMAAYVSFAMIVREVNASRSEKEQLDEWRRSDFFRALQLHAQLFLDSPRRRQMLAVAVVGVVLFFLGGIWFANGPGSR